MTFHQLKILPVYFIAVKEGAKTFEIRQNDDRGFQRGDTVELMEHDAKKLGSPFTGRSILVRISYVSNFEQKEGFVVFSFRKVKVKK